MFWKYQITSFWDLKTKLLLSCHVHPLKSTFPLKKKKSPVIICFVRKWKKCAKLWPEKSYTASFACEIKGAACLLGGLRCGGRDSWSGQEASKVPSSPPAPPPLCGFCGAGGWSEWSVPYNRTELSSVSGLGTYVWLDFDYFVSIYGNK